MREEFIGKFQVWWHQARADPSLQHEGAVCVSTVDESGFPIARFVDLKVAAEEGFTFCTWLDFNKGIEIERHPKVALTRGGHRSAMTAPRWPAGVSWQGVLDRWLLFKVVRCLAVVHRDQLAALRADQRPEAHRLAHLLDRRPYRRSGRPWADTRIRHSRLMMDEAARTDGLAKARQQARRLPGPDGPAIRRHVVRDVGRPLSAR